MKKRSGQGHKKSVEATNLKPSFCPDTWLISKRILIYFVTSFHLWSNGLILCPFFKCWSSYHKGILIWGVRQNIKTDVYFCALPVSSLDPSRVSTFLFYAYSSLPTPHPISLDSRGLLGGLLNLDQMHVMVSGKMRIPKTPQPAVGHQTRYFTSQRLRAFFINTVSLITHVKAPRRELCIQLVPHRC